MLGKVDQVVDCESTFIEQIDIYLHEVELVVDGENVPLFLHFVGHLSDPQAVVVTVQVHFKLVIEKYYRSL